ncbi:5-demethoxyubiquinone hydroxylase, mitochondrial isoform X2 [Penaeus vannamei]|uniref:5-demethoxyubiquinone hydroxylase, mitochondrial isoform X2 n=1 Tax=Penaeus vannamei TaxID=6689 RepID=UPI00387F3802
MVDFPIGFRWHSRPYGFYGSELLNSTAVQFEEDFEILNMLQSSLTKSLRLYSTKAARNRQALERIIRVDHAGELGADRIYAGQMAVLGKTSVGPVIQHMWDQEKEHKAKFEELIPKYRVRPTVLIPIWNVAGFALGAGTALLGKEAAMACTVAVESVITDHYNSQLRELIHNGEEEHKELIEVIKKFRDDEMDHHDTGLAHDAELAPAYKTMSNVIKMGCKAAVWISERI